MQAPEWASATPELTNLTMYTNSAPTNANWRHVVSGASVYVRHFGPMTIASTDPKSTRKALFARPTRRGAPPH